MGLRATPPNHIPVYRSEFLCKFCHLFFSPYPPENIKRVFGDLQGFRVQKHDQQKNDYQYLSKLPYYWGCASYK